MVGACINANSDKRKQSYIYHRKHLMNLRRLKIDIRLNTTIYAQTCMYILPVYYVHDIIIHICTYDQFYTYVAT